MKPQEAKEIIKVFNEIRSKNLPCEMPITKALNMAVEALEKQIPKKPILDAIFPSGVKWYLCPTCNHNGIEKVGCHCHNCGQALDWSDSE